MSDFRNIHPADELAAIREEIKLLESRENALRTVLMAADDAGREGDSYRAFVQTSTRENIDKAALIAEFGRDIIEPFIKKTTVQSLKLAEKDKAK